MAKSFRQWLDTGIPNSWNDVFLRTVLTLVAAFLALLLKEWTDTWEWDVPACAVDSVWVAGGALVLNAIFMRRTARGS